MTADGEVRGRSDLVGGVTALAVERRERTLRVLAAATFLIIFQAFTG